MHPNENLEICKKTRKFAADSLLVTLQKLFQTNQPISEVLLRDTWLAELGKNPDIFPDGWYTPPPHGMIILFADDKNINRLNYKSARPEEFWPKDDIFLNNKNGIIYMYASPVDKESGIIGDFGITLYFGDNLEIKNLIKTCLKIDQDIFENSKENMQFFELTKFAIDQLKSYDMQNDVVGITDKAASENKNITIIGHTIPATDKEWNREEQEILQNGLTDWEKTKDMISKKRVFIDSVEKFTIQPNLAFTIEPRAKVKSMPHLPESLSFHTIALFRPGGEKELLTNFDDLFKFAGMDYIL